MKFKNIDDREIQFEFIKIIQYEINDSSEIEEEVPVEVAVIPLKDAINMYRKKEYKSAWECLKQNAELNDPFTKYWKKTRLWPESISKRLQMIIIFSDTQCKYAVSLLGGLCKETDVAAKDKFYDKIIRYFELAANNPKYRNLDAMYYLEIFM
ncbi:9120_t:CDS:2 [Gigaspora margarita]|uniref:9120_t:CDS:1 n=1 Tax=Gigaspora margarita TaxID=4874 RepID=A0ABN7UIF4_GIGMA|nr:9120_t:CDS:2 [Gigaspora margarita]